MTLGVGDVLQGRYRIDGLLGEGGMGAVYRAWDLTLNVPVAIKENLVMSREARRQFSREAIILARTKHPNLPRVTDHFFVAGQGQYLVMDFIEGEDLGQMLERQGRLPVDRAIAWIAQVLKALDYLHRQSIIHRDVKPRNVRITPRGQAFLVDFGLAKVHAPGRVTTIGAHGVTPGFSPLEQYGQERTDARSDIYSTGATLYALLTGETPPAAPDLATGGTGLVPPRQLNPDVPAKVESAILRAMEMRPTNRFQTVAGFGGTLPKPSYPPPRTTPLKEGGPPPKPRTVTRTRTLPAWPFAGGAAVTLFTIVLAIWMLVGRGNGDGKDYRPEVAFTVVSSPTARSIAHPSATLLPIQTSTNLPSATSEPSATPTLAPSATRTPSATPNPTATPSPTASSTVTVTPEPTETPIPTKTLAPPTVTPQRTDTPVPTPKPIAPTTSKYFPLKLGQVYEYRWSNTIYHPDPILETLTVAEKAGQVFKIDMVHSEAEGWVTLEMRHTGLWWAEALTIGDAPYPLPMYMLLKYAFEPENFLVEPLNVGLSWEGITGSIDEWNPKYTSVSSVVSDNETVVVPAGTYENCLRVRTAYESEHSYRAGSREMWFSKELGLIKLVYTHRDGSITEGELLGTR